MELWQSIVLGIVEGLTEYLPISSTGHLILTSDLLNIPKSEMIDAFNVIIQSGAIFAVLFHYRALIGQLMGGFIRKDPRAQRTCLALVIAVFPAGVIGLSFASLIKAHLFGPIPVLIALFLGGLLMIVVERRHPTNFANQDTDFPAPAPKQALVIGVIQCFAMWPGMSRSMTTILGGRLVGLSPYQAAEFSFLLAIPTLLGASLVDLYKSQELLFSNSEIILSLLCGSLVSFIVALAVIRFFLGFLKSHSLEFFGWYRIFIAVVWALVYIY